MATLHPSSLSRTYPEGSWSGDKMCYSRWGNKAKKKDAFYSIPSIQNSSPFTFSFWSIQN
ncbi:hypothetical protein SAMN04488109_1108 [Chryseolinea serpens]|uniref:Uncharacterized protein n=1 Tax=Chryseolinea serpens TaxID=947013 RepID=A0A1M5LA56_9BACT|nr:hypothetical protein SAMN04488109_1108 [Chryseolinea serpens]